MKLIHTRLARSIWLFDIRDLNPKGKDLLGDLVEWIKDSYQFAVAPDPKNPVPSGPSNPVPPAPVQSPAPPQAPGGLLFQRGHFQARKEVSVEISNLTIYNDGIVVDAASSTEDGDRVAEDLLTSAAREFALSYDAETVRRKLYLSELIARSDLSLEAINPSLNVFADQLSKACTDGLRPQYRLGGISFWSEPNDSGIHKLFILERQAGKSLAEHRYFSQAQLQTAAHYSLLEALERAIAGA